MKIKKNLLEQQWPSPQDASYRPKEREEFNANDSPILLNDVDMFDQLILLNWCVKLKKRKLFNRMQTSYGLKHRFERDTGIKVSNGAFKGAMLLVGFTVKDMENVNWNFNVEHIK